MSVAMAAFADTCSFISPIYVNSGAEQFCRRLQRPSVDGRRSLKRQRRAGPSAVIEQLNKLSIRADLETAVASGSFGEVFFGALEPTGTPVVLKRPFSTSTARALFRTERAINRKLDGGAAGARPEHWPKFLGEYFWRSQTFLVWEREGDGATLGEYLWQRPAGALGAALGAGPGCGGLNVSVFRRVVGGLLGALAEVHGRGVVHRDVKPGNVLVGGGGGRGRAGLKLIDFGSACDVGRPFWGRGIDTLDPLYAGPERRLSVVGPEKFDVFSVGMIGASVLVPGLRSEARLREFRQGLAAAGFDLRRHRGGEVGALLGGRDAQARDAAELLTGMLRKSPAARKSVDACLRELGLR